MHCEHVQRAMDALIDNELDLWSSLRLRRHLTRCADCAAIHHNARQLSERVRSWRDVPASPALKGRISQALGAPTTQLRELSEHARSSRSIQRRARIWTTTARLAGAMTVAALAVALWLGGRPGSDVLAAVIRATEAARAWHLVATIDTGSVMESWFVLGLGSYERQTSQAGHTERITVDDGKKRYVFEPDKRQVEVWPSEMRDRASTRRLQQTFTGSGLLKELQRQGAPQATHIRDVVLKHRRLRQIGASSNLPRLYVDPETDRLVLIEDTGEPGHFRRCELDYPEPASIDPARFRFDIPPGVTVVDRNYVLQPKNSSEPGTVCSWRLLQLRKALLGYLEDHHGEWPKALRPELDAYVQDVGVFLCPIDPAVKDRSTSYVYHHPAAPVDAGTLETMEEQWRNPKLPDPDTSHRLGALVECRLHNGEQLDKLALYLDGNVLGSPRRKPPAAGK
jgi:hypothetical protein